MKLRDTESTIAKHPVGLRPAGRLARALNWLKRSAPGSPVVPQLPDGPVGDVKLPKVDDLKQALASRDDVCVPVRPAGAPSFEHPQRVGTSPPADECAAGGGPWMAMPHYWLDVPTIAETVPELGLSVLHGAYVFGGSISDRPAQGFRHLTGQLMLTRERGLIPASYGVLDGMPSLPADLVDGDGEDLRLKSPGEPVNLPGSYYLIGNAHFHFGHFVLEGLSRLWAAEMVERAVGRSLRFIVYEETLTPFASDILRLAGIEPERIVHAPRIGRCERLFAADCAMRTHAWFTDLQAIAWKAVSRGVERRNRGRALPQRVYLSRRRVTARPLISEVEVEELHRRFGYEIVHPEELAAEEQIRTVLNATSLAGAVGSQMYLAAFQRPGGRNIVYAPANFFLKDDMLIANALEHRLTVVFGSINDFHQNSGWSCDLDLVENTLRDQHR